jgi:hypothetical protein
MRVNAFHGSETSSKLSHISEPGLISMEKGRCAHSVWKLATKWTVRGLIPHMGQEIFSCVISDFHRDVDETCVLLGSYAASSDN